MYMYEDVEAELDKFLTLAQDKRNSFTSQSLYTRRKRRRYPLDRRLGGAQSWLEAAEKNVLSLPESETRFLGYPDRSTVTALRYQDDAQLLSVGRAARARSGWDAAKLQGGCDVILDNH